MIKSIFLVLFALTLSAVHKYAEARSATYVLCYKQNKVAWSEEHYNPRSVQSAYYKCVSDGGTPQLVMN
ncbi:hypothetical protein L1077_22910 [Pseudoalteromonas luteoviolacea]|uniref:hypothetical protein n=1 Tax=Pseudoalteromonas luteoviolacea TaxID=43657 RepID=UPI001F1F0E9B|nr:hypothetical protein [Pseudoalteromonas luteoviolacea]MCF6442280.1 hypothetical protein [Pseudoalteromonas luteoviolacea]